MSRETTDRRHCLVVEDQILIAMSVETYLAAAGIAVQTVASVTDARAWLASNTADIAIVHFMLKDGPATELAEDLKQRAIPFVIYSGQLPRHGMPPNLREGQWLQKPVSHNDLLKIVLNTLMTLSQQERPGPRLHS